LLYHFQGFFSVIDLISAIFLWKRSSARHRSKMTLLKGGGLDGFIYLYSFSVILFSIQNHPCVLIHRENNSFNVELNIILCGLHVYLDYWSFIDHSFKFWSNWWSVYHKNYKKKLFKGFDLNLEKNEYTLFYQTSNEWCITYVLIEKQKLPGLLIVFQNSIGWSSSKVMVVKPVLSGCYGWLWKLVLFSW
jgi:hypothetical protein